MRGHYRRDFSANVTVLLVVALLAVGSLLIQTGPLWVGEGSANRKLNPKNGLKRIFSLKVQWIY